MEPGSVLTSRKTVTSMLMMSPSFRARESGMPWQSTSFTEVQTLFGKEPVQRKQYQATSCRCAGTLAGQPAQVIHMLKQSRVRCAVFNLQAFGTSTPGCCMGEPASLLALTG